MSSIPILPGQFPFPTQPPPGPTPNEPNEHTPLLPPSLGLKPHRHRAHCSRNTAPSDPGKLGRSNTKSKKSRVAMTGTSEEAAVRTRTEVTDEIETETIVTESDDYEGEESRYQCSLCESDYSACSTCAASDDDGVDGDGDGEGRLEKLSRWTLALSSIWHWIWTASRTSVVLENTNSVARDHLASERTFLAYVRTSLGVTVAGVGESAFIRAAIVGVA
ncbi:hypothetical protein BDP27DRAFT_29880 [Rhodocollybia butyracea]|uniref:DUF202 domain-containing protein n=1 Tax=Rhodocollybia butyracea TaxID=206335 RepID=A0A9P5Q5G0_9AGAR|nr:hypothetical protein BDP27DRAFT_29880 [Rhodocollybia butyracea]